MWTSRIRYPISAECGFCSQDDREEGCCQCTLTVIPCSSYANLVKPLSTVDEILHNSIWRFLALREYVDDKHNLTAWGKVLAKAITTLKGDPNLEEAAVVAVELIRLGILNSDINMFPSYNGAPMRGEGTYHLFLRPSSYALTIAKPRTETPTS
jgi:hypothetical protein